jgi:glycerol transport system substrate-binding protein
MAGNGDRGLPNGKPVDEWGIRAEDGIPRGSSISRGGDANGPAAVYATTKFVEWLKKYAPPEAAGMDFLEAGAVPGQARVTSPSKSSGTARSPMRCPSPGCQS